MAFAMRSNGSVDLVPRSSGPALKSRRWLERCLAAPFVAGALVVAGCSETSPSIPRQRVRIEPALPNVGGCACRAAHEPLAGSAGLQPPSTGAAGFGGAPPAELGQRAQQGGSHAIASVAGSSGSVNVAGFAGAAAGSSGTKPMATCAEPQISADRPVRIAVIGDYGEAGPGEQDVADLVKRHSPDLIITTGDNNYPLGQAETIDTNIGQYYASFICPYLGDYGPGGTENRFFPALGNHDWYTADAAAYLDYFTLPGNERYYDFVAGYAHLFALDSEPYEPDGRSSDSLQALWLHYYLATSLSGWQIVYMHEPPYSSGTHGSTTDMRWPFRQWGADLVLAGHDHVYERLEIDDLTYITTGMGGRSRYDFVTPIEGSLVRYNELEGALFVDVDATLLRARFYNVEDALIDEVLITRD